MGGAEDRAEGAAHHCSRSNFTGGFHRGAAAGPTPFGKRPAKTNASHQISRARLILAPMRIHPPGRSNAPERQFGWSGLGPSEVNELNPKFGIAHWIATSLRRQFAAPDYDCYDEAEPLICFKLVDAVSSVATPSGRTLRSAPIGNERCDQKSMSPMPPPPGGIA